jgi:hypothetical protein
MNLTQEALDRTLGFIASLPGVVFDYALPRQSPPGPGRVVVDWIARGVAAEGEPFQLFFEPPTWAEKSKKMGFREIEDAGASDLNALYFQDRTDNLRVGGNLARMISAAE